MDIGRDMGDIGGEIGGAWGRYRDIGGKMGGHRR